MKRKHMRVGGKMMLRARYVMEQKLGRPLLPSEIVHHVNEDISDDTPDNLELKTRGTHNTHHKTGFKHSKKSKAKMIKAKKGKALTEETKQKMSEAHKGRRKSEEHKKHISESMKAGRLM